MGPHDGSRRAHAAPRQAPAQPLGRLRFMATFVRNPLQVLPRAVYEEDFVPLGADGVARVG